jgi:hypothetical protein
MNKQQSCFNVSGCLPDTFKPEHGVSFMSIINLQRRFLREHRDVVGNLR